MNVREFIAPAREYLPHVGILAATILVGVLLGLRDGDTGSAGRNAPDNWSLPGAVSGGAVAPEQLTAIAAVFFGDSSARQAKPQAAPVQAWRFAGTARAGEQILALIVAPKPAGSLRLRPGDKLPNGEEIVAVEDGTMRYTDQSGQHEVRAFRPARTASKEVK